MQYLKSGKQIINERKKKARAFTWIRFPELLVINKNSRENLSTAVKLPHFPSPSLTFLIF